MNIQNELQSIHHKYGTTEKANYEIQKLFDKYISEKIQNLNQSPTKLQCKGRCDHGYTDGNGNELFCSIKV